MTEIGAMLSRRRPGQRRRGLPVEYRAEFDARVLAGEDVALLAREYKFETWYAMRRAERVRAAQARKPPQPSGLDPLGLVEELGPIEAAIVVLNNRVGRMRDGSYVLRGFRVRARDVVRAANEVLMGQGLHLIPYPGLTPYLVR